MVHQICWTILRGSSGCSGRVQNSTILVVAFSAYRQYKVTTDSQTGQSSRAQLETRLLSTKPPTTFSYSITLVSWWPLTTVSLNAINYVYHGLWKRLPVYSPQFNPIELGFSNIREYVRAHDARAVTDPVDLLNEAFQRYSESDPRGATVARRNWAIFFATLLVCSLIL